MHTKYDFKAEYSQNLPREKLQKSGPDSLSNAELLSIIFITGKRGENVLEMSNRIIKEYGSRSITEIKDPIQVSELLEIGISKASQLVAVFEIGRRFYREQNSRMPVIRGPQDIFKICEYMQNRQKEELRAIYLNSRQFLIREELITLGNENMNIVSPKEIIQPAIELMAKGMIIVHNHPSGEVDPSFEDKNFTETLSKACDLMQIKLLDHIIIGKGGYFSFADEGLI